MNKPTPKFLADILDHVLHPIFVKNEKHAFIFVNDSLCSFLGISENELLGKHDYDFFPKEQADVFREKDRQVFETSVENTNEEFLTNKNGEIKIIITKKNIIHDQSGNKFLVGVIQDITEIRIHQQKLQESNIILSSYANLISHDLKNPLITIQSYSNLLIEKAYTNLNDEHLKFLKFINKSSERLSQLIDRVLSFSQFDNQELELEQVDIQMLVTDILVEINVSHLQKKDFLKTINLPIILADRKLIRLVFQNLILNAIKFHSKNRDIQCQISQIENEDSYLFSVSDNGKGIKKENIKKIFKMFKRTKSSSKTDGYGIGLAICNLIVNHHKGEIWVESTIDEGSTFHFSISKSL